MTAERVSAAGRADRESPSGGDGPDGEVLRLFEAKAPGWAAKYAPDGPLTGRLASLSAVVSWYARAGDLALDLGCGTGELARALAADGLRVTGCDISPQMLLRAVRDPDVPGTGRAGWVRLEPGWHRLPFACAAFDVVVASSVLEYVAEPAAVLRECARVLRPGGVLTGTLPPAFREAGFERFVAVATASGISARRAAERHGFEQAVSSAGAVIEDPDVSLFVIATPHDVHADLAARALAAGRDVWCEKPLALTRDDLDEVEKAWRGSGRQLALGFNRRWAPAVQAAKRALAEVTGPKLIVYRVAAGRGPGGHWYLDRRHGWRLLGEVCHFVDLAQALVGADIEDEVGVLGGDATVGNDGVAVSLRLADGSVAPIGYGSTPPVAGKERIEVLAGSRQVIIDDFRSVLVNGRTLWKGRLDKGHRAHAAAFRQAVQCDPSMPTEAMLASMRATIQVAAKVRET